MAVSETVVTVFQIAVIAVIAFIVVRIVLKKKGG
jgi:hypothetical protein